MNAKSPSAFCIVYEIAVLYCGDASNICMLVIRCNYAGCPSSLANKYNISYGKAISWLSSTAFLLAAADVFSKSKNF